MEITLWPVKVWEYRPFWPEETLKNLTSHLRSIENYLHMLLGKIYNISFLDFANEKPFHNLKAD